MINTIQLHYIFMIYFEKVRDKNPNIGVKVSTGN